MNLRIYFYASFVLDIRRFASLPIAFSIRHVLRSQNIAADYVAKDNLPLVQQVDLRRSSSLYCC